MFSSLGHRRYMTSLFVKCIDHARQVYDWAMGHSEDVRKRMFAVSVQRVLCSRSTATERAWRLNESPPRNCL
jgi:hypothetical protein